MTLPASIADLLSTPQSPPTLSLDPRHEVFVYGGGGIGRRLAAVLRQRGVTVAGILDRRGSMAGDGLDLPIYVPLEEPGGAERRASMHVVVGVFNPDADSRSIDAMLRDGGYGAVTSFFDAHGALAAELGDQYWLTGRQRWAEDAAQIHACASLWSDERSRAAFAEMIRFRVTGDLAALRSPDAGPPYFDRSVPPVRSGSRFVDCGAFDGDTIRAGREAGVTFEMVRAFEPDPTNFRALSDWAGSAGLSDVELIPCGVSDRTLQLRFSAGRGLASAITDSGETVIQCVSLDDAFPNASVTDVKMDIEGAEVDALRGAERLIRRCRPRLAVCVYHSPSHLWDVPLWLHRLGLGYKFFLRTYCQNHFETVVYASVDADRSPAATPR
jgi:FkbM family methyltransferase